MHGELGDWNSVCVCVCVCEREKERKRERDAIRCLFNFKLDGCHDFEPNMTHLTLNRLHKH